MDLGPQEALSSRGKRIREGKKENLRRRIRGREEKKNKGRRSNLEEGKKKKREKKKSGKIPKYF